MKKSAESLNMIVEDPEWIELFREDDLKPVETSIEKYKRTYGCPPILAMVILNYENNYSKFKTLCY